MKTFARNLYLTTADSKKVRIVLFAISIAMFVVTAGAPEATGGFVR